MPTIGIRVTVANGYGVQQEYSVDLWHGWTMSSRVYLVHGGAVSSRPIRRGTKVYHRAVEAARVKVSRPAAPAGDHVEEMLDNFNWVGSRHHY